MAACSLFLGNPADYMKEKKYSRTYEEKKKPSKLFPVFNIQKRKTCGVMELPQTKELKLSPLPPPFSLSEEQEEVSNCILNKINTSVIAKAGSGKTTASLEIARRFYEKYCTRTLLLTYNSRLKAETRERIDKQNLKHIVDAHSFHAAALNLFHVRGQPDDTLISKSLARPPPKPLQYGLVIVDESQDLTPLYYRFLCHVLAYTNKPVLLMLGDPFQRIFGFHNSTSDYLLEPEKYFQKLVYSHNIQQPAFALRHFTICWRITHEMASWINTYLNPTSLQHTNPEWWLIYGDKIKAWWGKGIRANPNRPPAPNSVMYFNNGTMHLTHYIMNDLFGRYNGDEIALLGYSLNANTPIRIMVDAFGLKRNENWFLMCKQNECMPTKELFRNKRVASTIHRFKGLERKAIAVFGFDNWIESIYLHNPIEHFNLMYVACTRAKDQLVVFCDANRCLEYATIRQSNIALEKDKKSASVSDILDYVPYDEILSEPTLFDNSLVYHLPHKEIAFGRQLRYIKGRILGTTEDISPFIGTAVHVKLGISFGVLPDITISSVGIDKDLINWVKKAKTIPIENWTWSRILTYAVALQTLRTGYSCYWRQLKHYLQSPSDKLVDFMTKSYHNALDLIFTMALDKNIVECKDINTEKKTEQKTEQKTDFSEEEMINLLMPFIDVEKSVHFDFPLPWWEEKYDRIVTGIIDIILDKKHIIELKVSHSGLSHYHALQVELYRSMKRINTLRQYSSWVLIANKAAMYQISLHLPRTRKKITEEKEFMYRMLRRRMGLVYNPSKMVKDYRFRSRNIK